MSEGVRLEYVKKAWDRTRTMPGKWDLASYRYKFNTTMWIPFMDKLKEKELIGCKCRSCNTVYFPPKMICGRCLVVPDKWVPIRQTGYIATFTATYVKDEDTGKMIPTPVIAVRFDGADTTFVVEMPTVKFEDVYVGMPVKVKWRDELKGTLDDIEMCVPIEDTTFDLPMVDTAGIVSEVSVKKPAKEAPAKGKAEAPAAKKAAAKKVAAKKAGKKAAKKAPAKKAGKKAAAKKAGKKAGKKAAKKSAK